MTLKAIETKYNGYRFRSRLEARWAVFFDSVGIKYRYETEGYNLNGIYYLPDFYLPDLKIFVEVKGSMTDEDLKKLYAFQEAITKDYRGVLILQDIPNYNPGPLDMYSFYNCGSHAFRFLFPGEGEDNPYLFCVCPGCGKVGIEFDGRGWRVDECREDGRPKECYYYPEAGSFGHEDKGYSYDHPKILEGYKKARRARFEHGEHGL